VFGLVLLCLGTLAVACQLVVVLRLRPAQRAAVPGLLRSPAALWDAAVSAVIWMPIADRDNGPAAWLAQVVAVGVLGAIGGALRDARRDDRPQLDAFCRKHGFERWSRRRRVPRPWRRREAADTLVVPEEWQAAAGGLVASLRRLGGSVEVLAAGSGWLNGYAALVADTRTGDAQRMAVWLDVRRDAGEIIVGPPPSHELSRRREVRHEPRLTQPGVVVTVTAEASDAEAAALLRPLDLLRQPLAAGDDFVLRLGPDGLLVAVLGRAAQEFEYEALADFALAVAAAARPGSERYAAFR